MKGVSDGDLIKIAWRKTGDNNTDIAFENEFVSRRHAEISLIDNTYKIRDLDSTNGTSINGKIIEPGNFCSLVDNAMIGLGIDSEIVQVELRFRTSFNVPTTRLQNVNIPNLNVTNRLRIDEKSAKVWVEEKLITLSKKEYAFLVYLYRKTGQVCTREELISDVWPEVLDMNGVSNAAIDQLVHRLRIKIEDNPSNPKRLINRKGFGFVLA